MDSTTGTEDGRPSFDFDGLARGPKLRRATACCTLASRILPQDATELEVERLATLLVRVPTSYFEAVAWSSELYRREPGEEPWRET